MSKKLIDPGWKWSEPYYYSQALRVEKLLFVSGQAAISPDGTVVGSGNFEEQAEQVLANLESVLKAAGGSLKDILKVTIFLTDMSNFPKIVELRKRYFAPPYPADTVVEVQALALPELLVEIEAIAYLKC